MMSWLRQVFQRASEGEPGANPAELGGDPRYSNPLATRRIEPQFQPQPQPPILPRTSVPSRTFVPPPQPQPQPQPVHPVYAAAPAESELLARLRRTREALAPIAASTPSLAPSVRALLRLESRLTRLPRLVILGEFNSGKSSLVNILLGSNFVPCPLTRKGRIPVLMRYSSQPVLVAVDAEGGRTPVDVETLSQWRGAPLLRVEAGLPSPLLRRVEILDLPGDAHPTHDIGDLPQRASRNAHFALWCTSATQAWKGSELRSWITLPGRLRMHSLLVATHKDRVRVDADCEKVHMRLSKEAGPFFRSVVMFSSLKAERCRDETGAVVDPDGWRVSGVDHLQSALADSLSSLSAQREQNAARVAQRIAAHVVKKLQAPAAAPQGTSEAASLLALWSRQAEAMAARVTAENVKETALLQEVALVIQGFGAGVLEPWLRQRSWTETSARLVGLFRCDPAMIAGAIEGVPSQAAVKRVHGALRQLHSELNEALAAPGSPLMASQVNMAEVRRALQPLVEIGRRG